MGPLRQGHVCVFRCPTFYPNTVFNEIQFWRQARIKLRSIVRDKNEVSKHIVLFIRASNWLDNLPALVFENLEKKFVLETTYSAPNLERAGLRRRRG